MQILVRDKYIITYVQVGGVKGGVKIDEDIIPSGFFENFEPNKYLYVDGIIVSNEDYKEKNEAYTPSNIEILLAQTQIQVAESSSQLRDVQKKLADSMLEIAGKDNDIKELKEQQRKILSDIAKMKGSN